MNQHAAIHVERDAGAVQREVTGEEDAGAGDVVSSAQAGERDGLGDLGLLVFAELALDDVGADQAGRDAVDADANGAELARHRACQAEYTGFGGRVMRAAEDAATALRGYRRDADDRAAALLLHRRQHGL